jgi:hypothetical protein
MLLHGVHACCCVSTVKGQCTVVVSVRSALQIGYNDDGSSVVVCCTGLLHVLTAGLSSEIVAVV